MEKRFGAVAFGSSGDQSQHLLWRLTHGELPLQQPPAVAAVLIGTNDLGFAKVKAKGDDDEEVAIEAAVPATTKRILQTLQYIHRAAPTTKVVLMGILPRGSGRGPTHLKQPSMYTDAIQEINLHMAEFASQDGRVFYHDCAEGFLTNGGTQIDAALMQDGLHPSGNGAQVLADCLAGALAELVPA